jgi:glycosyltransferase involved in cell wall biosynthesis
MPKILHLLHSLRFSGAEVMLRVAAPIVHEQGFEQHMLADGPTVGDYADILQKEGFIIHHRPYSTWSIPHLWRLYKFLNQHQFTIVHNHTEQNFFWYLLVAYLAGVPRLISTAHNAYHFRGHVRWRRGIYRWLARRALGTKFIAVGPSVADVEASTYYNPTILVPNWLDEKHFIPAQNEIERAEARQHFAIEDGVIVLLSIGTCSESKNHGAILESLSILRTRIAHPLLYLHVGEGSIHIDEQKQAMALGIADATRFVGQLYDVRIALLAADIFVMPSFFEGLGNSLLEALSCGIPAVVYDVYGLRDLVIEGKTGRCVPPNSVALTDALQELIEQPDLRMRYGKAGREFVQQHYSMHDSLSRLLHLYGSTVPVASMVTQQTDLVC